MTTPAQEKGFIENATRFKLSSVAGHAPSMTDLVWRLTQDDGTLYPFFSSECGRFEDSCFNLEWVTPLESVPELPVGPKFPIGSRVVVVDSGWGFGPEKIDQVYKVTDFTLRGSEITTYKVVDSEGQQVGKEIWEPAFKLYEVPPVEVPPSSFTPLTDTYTKLQQHAINTFQGMYDAAVAHREGRDSRLNGEYGICDNIDRFADIAGVRGHLMSEVKENLIRLTAIYSGSYNYPVPCPDGGDASNAFTRYANKWRDAYGFNRLTQLGQMIELIKSDKWTDDMVNRQTPATRNGLKVGDVVKYTRSTPATFWVFRYDDESSSPSFHKLTEPAYCADLDLNYIVKVDKDTVFKQRSVSEFLAVIKEQQDKKVSIEAQLADLQKQLSTLETDIAMLDFGLAEQHKVKRI